MVDFAVSGMYAFTETHIPQKPQIPKTLSTNEKVELILKNHFRIPAVLWHPIRTGHHTISSYNIALDYAGGYIIQDDNKKPSERNDGWFVKREHPTERVYCWLLDEYQPGNYSGEGERIGVRDDGRLMYGFTSHCSCNGPWESDSEIKSTDKVMDIKFEDVKDLDWGAPFKQNVDWLWNKMVEENPFIQPMEY